MQLHTKVIENCATAYPIVQLCTPTFRQEKAIQNDVMTTAYHQWYHDVVQPCTRSYTLHVWKDNAHYVVNVNLEYHCVVVSKETNTIAISTKNL